MLNRYAKKEMVDIWSEEHKWQKMLEVLCSVLGARMDSVIISSTPPPIQSAFFKLIHLMLTEEDARQIDEIEKVTRHDVNAFLDHLIKRAELTSAEAAVYAQDLTSYDLQDTANILRICEAHFLIDKSLGKLIDIIIARAEEHKYSYQIGRTHGVHAEPITFGWKLLGWRDSLERIQDNLNEALKQLSMGKISGAVGMYSLPPEVELKACQKLGLSPALHSTQILPRDMFSHYFSVIAILMGELERFSIEIRNLQRTETCEVQEFFKKGEQKGSSAMPHKRNPIMDENVSGAARMVRGYVFALLESQATWHERDLSNSIVERVNIPDIFLLTHFQLERFCGVMEKLLVYPERMLKNIELTNGAVFSRWLRTALEDKGMPRQEAYKLVQDLAFAAFEPEKTEQGKHLRDLAKENERVREFLTEQEIEDCFNLKNAVKHVDDIFARFVLPSP
ncbi:MAG: adenylosuccinate lyase [Patescibacteria group bacterium]|nr:adenylosuccinate lyase [Patescibacteria group bacterium]MDD5490538.1 adenylosuccinate lyase [Patescibacteria group bacterium]